MSRIAFVMIVVLLALILLTRIGQAITRWDGVDLDLYRRAAREWIEHGNPYRYEGTNGIESYRYGAWFAAIWIPFAGLPREVVEVVWSSALLAATGAIMLSLIREHGESGLPLALLAGALLISTTAGGNVQPLLVAAIYFGLHRPMGPVWVGVAASIKLVPILYVIPWIGRGEWGKALAAVLIMALGLVPTVLFNVPAAVTDPGAGQYSSIVIWLVLAGSAIVAAVLASRSRYAWLAAGTAAVLALPRLLSVDLSLMLPAARRR